MHHIFSPHPTSDYTTLADLRPGERATFLSFGAGRHMARRLIALGFTPGVEVSMVQNYRHGPLLVSIRGSYVAIGRGEARKIWVKRGLT